MARAEASGSRVAPDRGAYEDPLPEFVARRTAVCFSFLFAFPRTTATRARSADASTSKTSRVVEMAMSTRMTERDKENEHRVSNAQVLLRWALQRGVRVIPGATSRAHIQQNLNVSCLQLSEDEMQLLQGSSKPRTFTKYASGVNG